MTSPGPAREPPPPAPHYGSQPARTESLSLESRIKDPAVSTHEVPCLAALEARRVDVEALMMSVFSGRGITDCPPLADLPCSPLLPGPGRRPSIHLISSRTVLFMIRLDPTSRPLLLQTGSLINLKPPCRGCSVRSVCRLPSISCCSAPLLRENSSWG